MHHPIERLLPVFVYRRRSVYQDKPTAL